MVGISSGMLGTFCDASVSLSLSLSLRGRWMNEFSCYIHCTRREKPMCKVCNLETGPDHERYGQSVDEYEYATYHECTVVVQ